jgi:hypothetical protein
MRYGLSASRFAVALTIAVAVAWTGQVLGAGALKARRATTSQ